MLGGLIGSLLGAAGTTSRPEDTAPARTDSEDRLDSARRAAGFDADAEGRLSTDRTDGAAELDVRAPDVAGAYPPGTDNQLTAQHARALSKTVSRSVDDERAARVASVARKHAAADVAPSTYLGAYAPAVEQLVADAFDSVAADTDEAEADLLAGLRAALVDMQVGVDEFAATEDVDPLSTDDYGEELTLADLCGSLPYPSFLVDDEHTMIEYNIGQNRLLGLGDDHREFLGGDCRDTLAAATYADGSRHLTLADKVVKNPRDAEAHWDVERVDGDNDYTDCIVYRDSSVSTNGRGEDTHIGFVAMPIFDDEGDLKAVFEVTRDRTEEVRESEAVEGLVTEVTDTLRDIGAGDLSSRAAFEDEHDALDPSLLDLTAEVNGMADSFETLVERVGDETASLASSIERATDSAHRIHDQVEEQNDSLENVAGEMADFSATMEEVAASSNEVSEAATAAMAEVDRGVEAGADAREVIKTVGGTSDELIETVDQLDEQMDEIGKVVDVIADVAEQTNLLALNANIEAARAGDDGNGFEVVAEEVKSLADETRTHTEDITERIEAVQAQTAATVEAVERSHEHVHEAEREIESAMTALKNIAERVERAVDGTEEVADANDEQAVSVEEVTATVDEVRDSAADVSESVERIVAEAETQESAVSELVERVSTLTEGQLDRR
jgi:methyl-accepting chemotaxis protein